MDISDEAYRCIRKMEKQIFERFASDKIYRPIEKPVTFFMAGSPGAGKTEYSKNFIKNLNQEIEEKSSDFPIVRIDADEFRELCDGYNGNNSHLFQKATTLAVNILYDYVLKKSYNALIDGTFSSPKYAEENIKRALKKGREVKIFYIYQDPLIAWEFTQKREKIEGRQISIDTFIKDFFNAKDNVNKVKEIFGKDINVDLIIKDYYNQVEKIELNIDKIDNYLKFEYNRELLYNKLSDIKL